MGGSNTAQQESAWGPVGTYVAKRSATGTKTDTPIEKNPQSVSVVTREEMDMRQPDTVKGALAYAPGVFASRGSSSTYDAVAIRGFRPPILPSIWMACGCWAITTAKRPSILIS